MLEFITENSSLLSVLTISATALFAFIKWLDNRNSALKEQRYSKYMALISVISGKREDGQTPNITEQIAATWFLLEYREYYEITEKNFSNNDFQNMASITWNENVLPHIKAMLKEISA